MIRKLPILAALMLSACASGGRIDAAPGVAATVDPTTLAGNVSYRGGTRYRLGAGDKLALTVFRVPDLSFEEIFVDAAGNIQLPLLNSVEAAGKTPAELSDEIEQRLGERYLRNPEVMVAVLQAASQKITVDGAVTKAGVYEMRGRTTLMQAVAMAEGPTRIANLGSVAVFRTVEDRRMVAIFDLGAIRGGQAADPELLGDDVIVVDTSRLSSNIRDVVEALPGLAVFTYF